jgi:hypothetical protein
LYLVGPGLELLGSETEITALDMPGYVAAVPGLHEFESGPDLAGVAFAICALFHPGRKSRRQSPKKKGTVPISGGLSLFL